MVDAATLTPDGVMMLFAAGLSTRQIADDPRCEYGLRRVQQLVAPLRPEPPPVPDAVSMDELVANARAGHGPNYGTPMLLGALRSAYPGWAFPEREVEDALRRLFAQEFELRRHTVCPLLPRRLAAVVVSRLEHCAAHSRACATSCLERPKDSPVSPRPCAWSPSPSLSWPWPAGSAP